jgi:hypothetical protein
MFAAAASVRTRRMIVYNGVSKETGCPTEGANTSASGKVMDMGAQPRR